MNWKKSTFKKELETLIHKKMGELNYLYNKKRLSFIKKRESSYSTILYQTTMNDCPKSSVGFHFSCSIHLDEITEILSQLNNEASITATLFGKMKTFTTQASNDGSFYFDWNKDYLSKLEELFKNVREFDAFCERIKSVSDLAPEKLSKIPFIRKLFPSGLEDNFGYCIPAVAALVHELNGDSIRALLMAEKDLQRMLKISERPKSVIPEENLRTEQALLFSQNLVEFIRNRQAAL